MGLEYHPLADCFPLMTGEPFQELVEDLKANGLRERITVLEHDGVDKILDGRNRARACPLAGIEPQYVRLHPGADPVAYVISKNLIRRNLPPAQRALIALELLSRGKEDTRPPLLKDVAEIAKVSPTTAGRVREALHAKPGIAANVRSRMLRGEITARSAVQETRNAQSGRPPSPYRNPELGITDRVGVPISNPSIIDDFRAGPQALNHIAQQIEMTIRIIQGLLKEGSRWLAYVDVQDVIGNLQNAKLSLTWAKPYALCPYCCKRVDRCTTCHSVGWMPKAIYRRLPSEHQQEQVK